MKEGTGMRKELVKSGKRILCGFLCAGMILTGTAFAQAEETGSIRAGAQDDPGIVFQEDFESYEPGQADPDAMQDAYGTIEGGTIVETEEGKAIAVSDGKIYLEIGNVDKELQFDFQYDNPFSGYGGIYIRMYYGTGGDYYCGILPNFDPTLIIANAGGWLNNNSSLRPAADTWYTCRAKLEGNAVSIKIWERGAQEPQDWTLTAADTGFSAEYGSGVMILESHHGGSNNRTLFDNIVIRQSVLAEDEVSIGAKPDDSQRGTVIGGGTHKIGEEVTLTAKAKPDYKFVSWTQGGEVISTEKTYTFTAEKSCSLTANFEPLEDPQYEYFFDDFESYPEGKADKEFMDYRYTKINDGYSIQEMDGTNTLLTQLVNDSDHKIYLDYADADKQFQFDFQYDKDFVDFGGLFVKLHAQPKGEGTYDEYYFALCPNYGDHNIMISNTSGNLAWASKQMSPGHWYTCKSRIYDGSMMVKVWERGTEEPLNWDLTSDLYGFDWKTEGTQFKIEYVDTTQSVNTYLDNLSVKTWKDVDKKGYLIDAQPNDKDMGDVIGEGNYLEGSMVTLQEKQKDGYQFVNWTDEEGNVLSTDKKYYLRAYEDRSLTTNFRKAELVIQSFMADGLTELAEIDQEAKTVKLTFASDVDLEQVRPYFYYDIAYTPSVLPYEIMDLSGGTIEFDGWTIYAEQNDVMKHIYVDAARGDDANSGADFREPFETIQRAQEEVREIKDWTGDVIVHLAKGQYTLDETLEFTADDGAEKGYSVIYQGAGANDSVINSGIELKGWRLSTDVPGVEGVYEIDVPEGAPYSRDLFVGGKRATLAEAECSQDEISSGNDYGYEVTGTLADMADWRNKSDIEFVYYVMWTSNILPVQDVVRDGDTVKVIMKPEPYANSQKKLNCNPDKPSMIVNAFELLDQPNEWYFDRERNKIYYIPEKGQNPDDLDIVLPTLEKLVEVKGEKEDKVYGLAFQDIGFRYTSFIRPHIEGQIELQASFVYDPTMIEQHGHDNYLKTPGGVTAGYVEGMRIDSCVFALMSAGGFDFEEGVVGSTITGSRFEQIGATGIQIGGVHVRDAQPYSDVTYEKGVLNLNAGPDPLRVTEDILVMSNVIDTTGNNFKGSIGIWAGYVRDLTLAHNEISNIAYSGISAGWGWGIWDVDVRPDIDWYYKFDTPTIQARYVIENNDISYCMQRLKDGGAIYTLSSMPGSMIRGNFIHDVANEYGAIYLDEGTSGMEEISDNVVYNVYNPYFFNDKFGLFQDLDNEAAEVIHDNFWTTGAPEDESNESFQAIRSNAGNFEDMRAPELGDYTEDEPVDFTELRDAVAEAEKVDLSKYTEETAAELQQVLEEVKGLLDDPFASQEEVEAAVKALEEAVQGLEEITSEPEEPDDGKDPDDGGQGDVTNSGGGTGQGNPSASGGEADPGSKAVQTGDSMHVTMWILLAAAALGISVPVYGRRKKNSR